MTGVVEMVTLAVKVVVGIMVIALALGAVVYALAMVYRAWRWVSGSRGGSGEERLRQETREAVRRMHQSRQARQ